MSGGLDTRRRGWILALTEDWEVVHRKSTDMTWRFRLLSCLDLLKGRNDCQGGIGVQLQVILKGCDHFEKVADFPGWNALSSRELR